MKLHLVFLLLGMCYFTYSQTGINTTSPDASAELDIVSTNKGILIPRLTDAQMTGMGASGAGDQGLLIYNTDQSAFYYYDGTAWTLVGGVCNMLSDEDGDTKVEVEQSADEDIIHFTAAGTEVLEVNTSNTYHKAGTFRTASGGTIQFGNEYSLPATDGLGGDVLSIDNTGEAVWRNPAAALGLVVGIETSSFTNVISTHNLEDNVYFVRVMPWSNIRVRKMALLVNSVGFDSILELGIYDSGQNLLSSGVSDSIPNTVNDSIVEITLDNSIELTAGQIYWFAAMDRLNGNLEGWRYEADDGVEFSCRIQNTETSLPATAVFDNNFGNDRSYWIAAY